MFYHLHKYKFESSTSNGHNHMLLGYTDGMIGLNLIHFHHYYGVCSYNGHTHYFSGFTSLPIRTEFGHIHRMEGSAETNILHEHKYSSFTSEDVENKGSFGYRKWAIGSR